MVYIQCVCIQERIYTEHLMVCSYISLTFIKHNCQIAYKALKDGIIAICFLRI